MLFVCVCACARVRACVHAHVLSMACLWRQEDNLRELVLSSYHVGLGESHSSCQSVRPGSICLSSPTQPSHCRSAFSLDFPPYPCPHVQPRSPRFSRFTALAFAVSCSSDRKANLSFLLDSLSLLPPPGLIGILSQNLSLSTVH